jgi:hypothetical protein
MYDIFLWKDLMFEELLIAKCCNFFTKPFPTKKIEDNLLVSFVTHIRSASSGIKLLGGV